MPAPGGRALFLPRKAAPTPPGDERGGPSSVCEEFGAEGPELRRELLPAEGRHGFVPLGRVSEVQLHGADKIALPRDNVDLLVLGNVRWVQPPDERRLADRRERHGLDAPLLERRQ